MIGITSSGDNRTRSFLQRVLKGDPYSNLHRYGQLGVDALSRATPVETSRTSQSWAYRIVKDHYGIGIEWYNTHIVDGTPVVILLQYGHGTGTGGYVQGRDFINPAMKPIFDMIADEVWKKVKS